MLKSKTLTDREKWDIKFLDRLILICGKVLGFLWLMLLSFSVAFIMAYSLVIKQYWIGLTMYKFLVLGLVVSILWVITSIIKLKILEKCQ